MPKLWSAIPPRKRKTSSYAGGKEKENRFS
jgi:hypothetical protein